MTADQGAGTPPPPPPPQAGGSPTPAAAPRRQTETPPTWEIVVMASGLLMLIFSFLAFYKVDEGPFNDSQSWSAWSNAFNLFPLATLIVIFGVGLAAVVAAARFGGVSLPERVFGFSWSDLRLVVGALGALTLITYLLRSTEGIDKGIGLIITTLAAIGLLVGAVMERQGTPATAGDAVASGGGQPSPAAMVVLGAGVLILIGSFLSVIEDTSAWGEAAFPLYTLPALLGVVMAVQIALTEFTQSRLPGSVLGLSWNQIHLALGGWAALMMICFLIGRASVEGLDIDRGIGFWIMLIAAIGLVVGAVMREQEGARPAAPAASPPPPPPPPAA